MDSNCTNSVSDDEQANISTGNTDSIVGSVEVTSDEPSESAITSDEPGESAILLLMVETSPKHRKDTNSTKPLTLRLTGTRVDLQWEYTRSPNGPVDADREERFVSTLIRWGEYTCCYNLPAKRRDEIGSSCIGYYYSKKHRKSGLSANDKLQLEQAFHVRREMLKDKRSSSVRKAYDVARTLESWYRGGGTVAQMCERFDLPPTLILGLLLEMRIREVLVGQDVKHRRMKKLKNGCYSGTGAQFMDERLQEQMRIAVKMDSTHRTPAGGANQVENASLWEDSLYAYLDARNVKYLKDKELKKMGSKSTPDCLFLDDVHINGEPLRWLDMKGFFGTGMARIAKNDLVKQANKYDKLFQGRGAMVYEMGYSTSLPPVLPNTLFLDGGPLVLPVHV